MEKFLFWALLTISFSILHNNIYCQFTTFTYKYSTLQDEMPTDAIETPDGGYIIAAKQGDRYLYSYHTLLIKLNQFGDTVKTLTLSNKSGNCYIYDLMRSDDGNYFGVGSSQMDSSEMSVWMIKIDTDLNILFDKKYHSNCQDISLVNGLRNYNGEILLYGDGLTDWINYYDLFILRVNQNGDSIRFNIYPDPSNQHALSMIEMTDTSGYCMMILGRYQINLYSWGQFLRFDNDLNVTNIDSIPGKFLLYYNSLAIGKNFLFTGIKVISIPNQSEPAEKLGIMKLDSSYQVLTEYSVGSDSSDSLSYPGYIHNLDSADIHNIYYGGTFNQDNNVFLSQKKSWFLLAKFDTNLNLKWEKYYGGDCYYGLWSVNATSDGGCLLSGTTYDYLTQDNERDIFIIKVDSNGLYTGTYDLPAGIIKEAIIYPNPGTDHCFIDLGGQYLFASLTIYDLNGNICINQVLSRHKNKVITSHLPAGIYFYTITTSDRVIGSGKWIRH